MLKELPHVGVPAFFDNALRTEDVRFSPSGRILATVATSGEIYLFAVDTLVRPIRISRYAVLRSAALVSPHGIDFVDEDLVVVANRGGWITFHRLPALDLWEDDMTVEVLHEMPSAWFGSKGATRVVKGRTVNCGPGSVRVRGDHLVVSCNNRSTVTTHPFVLRGGTVETRDGSAVAQSGLEIPDGLALSRDGRWMAVGDHEYRRVAVFGWGATTPCCLLTDVDLRHPHGLCFDPSGHALYVADAGEREVHVFVSTNGWRTTMNQSAFKLPAVEPEAFRKTKAAVAEPFRPLEGGIKGLDVDPSGRIVATTCQNQMLRFFEAGPVAKPCAPIA